MIYLYINFMLELFVYDLCVLFTETSKQTNKRWKKTYFFIWTALGCRLHRREGLSPIYLYSSRGKERGAGGVIMPALCSYENICKLKTRNHKLDVNETCLIYVPPQHLSFQKKWVWQLKGGQGVHPKNHQKTVFSFLKHLENILWIY